MTDTQAISGAIHRCTLPDLLPWFDNNRTGPATLDSAYAAFDAWEDWMEEEYGLYSTDFEFTDWVDYYSQMCEARMRHAEETEPQP